MFLCLIKLFLTQTRTGKKRRQKRFLGNYRCELCYSPFYRQRDLEEHMELVHGPAGKEMILRSITCEICKKKLKTKRLLARHKFKGENQCCVSKHNEFESGSMVMLSILKKKHKKGGRGKNSVKKDFVFYLEKKVMGS